MNGTKPKRAGNQRKHNVDFADAVGALIDPNNRTVEYPDAEGEARYITLGRGYCDQVMVVVWTEREGGVIRIISARRAKRGERKHYRG